MCESKLKIVCGFRHGLGPSEFLNSNAARCNYACARAFFSSRLYYGGYLKPTLHTIIGIFSINTPISYVESALEFNVAHRVRVENGNVSLCVHELDILFCRSSRE